MTTLEAPIVAVTVYPDRARVTRRGTVRLAEGEHRVLVEPLPLGLQADSVRVAGRGAGTVLGVDVIRRHHARTGDAPAAGLEQEYRDLTEQLAEVDDTDAVQRQRADFLQRLAQRAGATFARTLAAGDAAPGAVQAFADQLTEQLTAVRARQRELARQRALGADRLAAVERQLADVRARREPDRLAVAVGVRVERADEFQVELSYVVGGAGWESSYDLRLDGEKLSLTWLGLVSQRTGEDWPECELLLSTARPSGALAVPELDPWYLGRRRPPVPVRPGARPGPLAMASRAMPAPASDAAYGEAAGAAEAAPLVEAEATVTQGVSAATYRPAGRTAVPADGGAHRTTVAVLELAAALDYVTAPVLSTEAHLRATVANDSAHTLLPGPAAVFHGTDYVGRTALETWAPGEQIELALGVDDRIRVERDLVRRVASKAPLGSTRRREVAYRTSIANHTPAPARVTVLDQLPVARDEGITVRELRVDPAPQERTDLGVLTWRFDLEPGQSREVVLGLRVELARGVEMTGWRE